MAKTLGPVDVFTITQPGVLKTVYRKMLNPFKNHKWDRGLRRNTGFIHEM